MQSVQVLDAMPDGVGTKKVVKVRDIYIASYLKAKHYKFLGAERGKNGYQSAFFFEDVPEGVVLGYINGESEAAELFNAFKAMRSFSSHVVVDEASGDVGVEES